MTRATEGEGVTETGVRELVDVGDGIAGRIFVGLGVVLGDRLKAAAGPGGAAL